jgi:hypothetical protein
VADCAAADEADQDTECHACCDDLYSTLPYEFPLHALDGRSGAGCFDLRRLDLQHPDERRLVVQLREVLVHRARRENADQEEHGADRHQPTISTKPGW